MEPVESDTKNTGVRDFAQTLAQYYMDFINTDFHRERAPSRRIVAQERGNLTAINLKPYGEIEQKAKSLLSNVFAEPLRIGLKQYIKPESNADQITLNKTLYRFDAELARAVADSVDSALKFTGEPGSFEVSFLKDESDAAIRKALDEPVTATLQELARVLPELVEDSRTLADDFIDQVLTQSADVLVLQLESVVDESSFRSDLRADVQDLVTPTQFHTFLVDYLDVDGRDLFRAAERLLDTARLTDNSSLYLYFGEIVFNRNKYPIGFVPLLVNRASETLSLSADSKFYLNKKAVEFISQNVAAGTGNTGQVLAEFERILYWMADSNEFSRVLSQVMSRISSVFELDSTLQLAGPAQELRSEEVTVRNTVYLVAAENSDEAISNDYEKILAELRSEHSVLATEFTDLVDGFVNREPEPVVREVDAAWNALPLADQLIYESPVPLNEEQRLIVKSLENPKTKYVVIEGPPGTGKSHTITALVFNAILADKSVLVLSDKKEALDVVYDKIVQTLAKARPDHDFVNPVLRVGETGNSFAKIVTENNLGKLKSAVTAFGKRSNQVNSEVEGYTTTLQGELQSAIDLGSSVGVDDIYEMHRIESALHLSSLVLEADEVDNVDSLIAHLGQLRDIGLRLEGLVDDSAPSSTLVSTWRAVVSGAGDVRAQIQSGRALVEFYRTVVARSQKSAHGLGPLQWFVKFDVVAFAALKESLLKYESLRTPLFGFAGKRSKIEPLDAAARATFALFPDVPDFSSEYRDLRELAADIETIVSSLVLRPDLSAHVDPIETIFVARQTSDVGLWIDELDRALSDLAALLPWIEETSSVTSWLDIDVDEFPSLWDNVLVELDDADAAELCRYVALVARCQPGLSHLYLSRYSQGLSQIQDLATTKLANALDTRILNFVQDHRASVMTAKRILASGQEIPESEFLKIKQALPCIIAGLRDYADFVPLISGMFDLLIIDEASQVSIAQALPALVRAKQVVVLGDSKQFSNVKSRQAKLDMNTERRNILRQSFETNISRERWQLTKFDRFDVRTSILEFVNFLANYSSRLIKHFRGYPELIGYSNRYFYQDGLQVMKIRGMPIDSVIKFSFVEPVEQVKEEKLINRAECTFILEQITQLLDQPSVSTVGVITPHTDQQKYISQQLLLHPRKDEIYDRLRLKVMTFDTCQGEERDVIFYSMVARSEQDSLNRIFPTSTHAIDEDGKLKAQRLNVGLSRAKETMHFVLSKPLTEYSGAIGEALRHYEMVRERGSRRVDSSQVDPLSPMEAKLVDWFYETSFYKENADRLELLPQFEIGEYFRQLDTAYTHPAYRVDFLLIYTDDKKRSTKIVVEYDGFKEHFSANPDVTAHNSHVYLSEDDKVRQSVLEAYGLRFVRFNRFNLGHNPIDAIDQALRLVIGVKSETNRIVAGLNQDTAGLINKEKRVCPKCDEVRELADFEDATAASGIRRHCASCRAKAQEAKPPKPTRSRRGSSAAQTSAGTSAGGKNSMVCPECGGKLSYRNGKYGQFIGCSAYPKCRYTRNK